MLPPLEGGSTLSNVQCIRRIGAKAVSSAEEARASSPGCQLGPGLAYRLSTHLRMSASEARLRRAPSFQLRAG